MSKELELYKAFIDGLPDAPEGFWFQQELPQVRVLKEGRCV